VTELGRRVLRTRLAPVGLAILIVLVLCAVFAGSIAPYDPTFQDYASTNQGPSRAHWFGTDHLGRDILSRVIYGSRVSLLVGSVAVIIGLGVGVTAGVVAGYFQGKTDALLMRASDAIWAFPALMLALAITSVLGRGVTGAMIAIGAVNIPFFARLARASTLSVSESDFVMAGKALGVPHLRLAARYILPNISAPIVVQASLLFGVRSSPRPRSVSSASACSRPSQAGASISAPATSTCRRTSRRPSFPALRSSSPCSRSISLATAYGRPLIRDWRAARLEPAAPA
jgi:ABC-type dipeptide/oligopeptide/nickel transport system permease subunit